MMKVVEKTHSAVPMTPCMCNNSIATSQLLYTSTAFELSLSDIKEVYGVAKMPVYLP